MASSNGNGTHNTNGAGLRLKTGLAEMLKGGVIMDVMSVAQARIAEEAGAVAVMALERASATLLKPRCSNPLASTSSTSPKS